MDEPSCPGCRELLKRNAELAARIRELEARLGQNASNSSIPPSANPPQAPPPVKKKPTGRKPGGQPGHQAHLRARLPSERLTEPIVHYRPKICEACHGDLPSQSTADDPEPRWHQVVELPEIPVQVTEYQAHARTCPSCRHVNWAKIPDAIRDHVCGPRLTATLSFMSGVLHVGKRGIEEFAETVFQAPIALGTVSNLEQEMSAALESAHAEAQQAVQEADAKNVDETGWKKAGDKRWLWGGGHEPRGLFRHRRHTRRPWPACLVGRTNQGHHLQRPLVRVWTTESRQAAVVLGPSEAGLQEAGRSRW
jgi:transposase